MNITGITASTDRWPLGALLHGSALFQSIAPAASIANPPNGAGQLLIDGRGLNPGTISPYSNVAADPGSRPQVPPAQEKAAICAIGASCHWGSRI